MQHPLHARDGASSSSSPSLVINHSSPLLQSHNFNSHTTIKNGKRNNSARHTNNTNNSPHNNNNPHTSIINDVNNKNNNDEQVNQVNQVSQSNRKVQLHQIYRMYENDRINEMCSASDDSPKVVIVPLTVASANRPQKFSEVYPSFLRGYMSESYYVDVICQLNHMRDYYKTKMISPVEASLLTIGMLLIVPVVVLAVRLAQVGHEYDKAFAEMSRYLESISNCSKNVKWTVERHSTDFKVSVEVVHSKFYRPIKLGVKHF